MAANELDVRFDEMSKAADHLNAEFGKCLDRASLLISVARSLGIDQLNAAKVGSAGPRFDFGPVFEGIEHELSNAQLRAHALEECKAEMRDLWKVKRAMR
jgi:hypothetical protein